MTIKVTSSVDPQWWVGVIEGATAKTFTISGIKAGRFPSSHVQMLGIDAVTAEEPPASKSNNNSLGTSNQSTSSTNDNNSSSATTTTATTTTTTTATTAASDAPRAKRRSMKPGVAAAAAVVEPETPQEKPAINNRHNSSTSLRTETSPSSSSKPTAATEAIEAVSAASKSGGSIRKKKRATATANDLSHIDWSKDQYGVCQSCGEEIQSSQQNAQSVVIAFDMAYHRWCLVCNVCSESFVDPLGLKKVCEGPDGFAYCEEHFQNSFPHCPRCKKLTGAQFIEAGEGKYHIEW
jgi:RNA polymerase-binding transcription factor DksA